MFNSMDLAGHIPCGSRTAGAQEIFVSLISDPAVRAAFLADREVPQAGFNGSLAELTSLMTLDLAAAQAGASGQLNMAGEGLPDRDKNYIVIIPSGRCR